MASGEQFNVRIGEWARRFAVNMDALARQTCQQISENVVRDTPVDTGFLRSSWQPSIGQQRFKDVKQPDGDGGARVVAEVALTAAQMKAGEKFYMSNNANYANYVEFGTSKMRGRFFVTRNVKRARNVVSAVAKSLGAK